MSVLRVGAYSVRLPLRGALVALGLTMTAVAAAVVALSVGDFPIPIPDVVATLFGQGSAEGRFIVGTLRAPRVVIGLLVGAALGTSGALFQSLSRNPLGSPDFIGFTSGAATGGIVAVILGGTSWHIAGGSLLGCLATATVVYLLSYRRGVQGYRLILVGIGVSAMLVAVNSYLLTRANIWDAASAAAWLTGSLGGRSWAQVAPVAAVLVVVLPVLALLSGPMRMLELGDDTARAMGIPAERVRLTAVVAGVVLCGVATAAAGPVAFVALVAPQLARRLARSQGITLVTSALMGAALLVVADVAAQRVFAPHQLPVGVTTAALGGTYLALMLRKERG